MEKTPLVKRRFLYILTLYGLVAVGGAMTALLPPERSYSGTLWGLSMGLLLALLVMLDARLLGRPLPHSAGWLILVFWPVAAPGCLIALRKWAGLGLVLVHGFSLLALHVVVVLGLTWLVA